MNNNFIEYFRENFFQNKEELDIFLSSINKNITKTLRVNTNKIGIEELKISMENKWFILDETFQKNMFYAVKKDDFTWIERRLWFSLEHLNWYFYIQELWAWSSVFYLSEWKKDENEYLILDMASSPWWKTTQLSEYYPNSFIVANEFDKNRTSQLLVNIERMWCENIWVTSYNWQFLWRLTETFDKVLLDAPCSWEWVWFKVEEHLKYWNIKNIKKISDLQKKLIESAFSALKIWWELLYSTCTMNKMENEQVIKWLDERYPNSFDIIFEKRFWPHIDMTWWFYVCKILKKKSIEYKFKDKEELYNKNIEKLNKNDEKIISDFYNKTLLNLNWFNIYKYQNEIIILKNKWWYKDIEKRLYFFRLWKRIWKIENNSFIPNHYIWRDFGILNIERYDLKNEQELDRYLRWFEISTSEAKKWYIQLFYENTPIWLSYSDWEIIKNNFPQVWLRK